jgi:hypothetical protein
MEGYEYISTPCSQACLLLFFILALNADNHVSSHPIQALRPILSANSNPRAGLSLANVWNESESSRGPIMNVFSFFFNTTGL